MLDFGELQHFKVICWQQWDRADLFNLTVVLVCLQPHGGAVTNLASGITYCLMDDV